MSLYVEGSGPAVLVLQGGPGLGSRSVAPVCDLLRECFRVVRFENTSNTITGLIEHMEALRRQLGEERWFVLGHSWGAAMAAIYAEAHPERVQGIVLVHPMEISSEFSDPVEHPPEADPPPNEDYAADLAEALWEDLQARWPDAAEEGYDLTPVARRLAAPALVLIGDRDPIEQHSSLLWAELCGGQFVSIADCDHWSFIERPRQFRDTVIEFLEAQTAQRTVAAVSSAFD